MKSNLFSIERRKLWRAKSFWIALLLGFIMAGLNAWYQIKMMLQMALIDVVRAYGWVNPTDQSGTLYNCWIGNESSTFGFSLFYFLFPVVCVVPYGWSLASEMQSGYLKNIVTRANRKRYFVTKYWTTFLGGSVAGTLPLILNLFANAMFIPPIKPDIWYPYYMMLQTDFLSDLFCEYPLIFNGLYFLFSAIYFGLIAGCAWSFSFVLRNKTLSVIVPVGVLLLLHYISGLVSYSSCKYDLSPLYCIHPTPVRYHSSGWVLLTYMIIMVVFSYAVAKIKGNEKYEVY